MSSIREQIENTLMTNEGKIFSIYEFYYLATKNTVKSILYRLSKEGKIVRVFNGMYANLKYSETEKSYIYPSPHEIARKIAEKYMWTIAPNGDAALYYTGFTDKAPEDCVYFSNGPYRKFIYRDQEIIFKTIATRRIKYYSKELSILIQAIRALGKNNVNESDIEKLAVYAEKVKEHLVYDTYKLPRWMKDIFKQIHEVKESKTTSNKAHSDNKV